MDATIIILLISLGILALINLFYRILIDQKKATQVKERVKELNKELKQSVSDKQKMNSVYSEIMKEQSKLMKMSLKPMLISFIVVACFLPVINMYYGDVSIPMTTSGLDATNATIGGIQNFGGTLYHLDKNNDTLKITNEKTNEITICELPCRSNISSDNRYSITKTDLNQTHTRVTFSNIVAVTPFTLPIIGSTWSWIIWYILVSIPLMIIIRKMYGIKV